MPKYINEREIPVVEKLSERDIKATSIQSNRALAELDPDIQWQYNYISKDIDHCVDIARDEEIIRKHAEKVDTPILSITEGKGMLNPTTSGK